MKDAYYFPHDSNARNDPKILALRSKYKVEGFGRYWIFVEMLREMDGYRMPENKFVYDAIAMQMQCTNIEAREFIEDCITEFELFYRTDDRCIASQSLNRRMKKVDDIREQRRESANKRWNKPDAKAEQKQSKSIAIASNKEKVDPKVLGEYFASFWQSYPKKIGKGTAEKAFRKIIENLDDGVLPDKFIQTLISSIEEHKASEGWRKEGGTYIPYPTTWLNAKGWEDVMAIEVDPLSKTSDSGRYEEIGGGASHD